VAALRGLRNGPGTTCIGAVGHQPHLSRLAAYLLCGSVSCVATEFGTASVMALAGELRAGGMTLTALLPARALRALLAAGDGAGPRPVS
jgi:phosphohistidine phosphatase SixA